MRMIFRLFGYGLNVEGANQSYLLWKKGDSKLPTVQDYSFGYMTMSGCLACLQ